MAPLGSDQVGLSPSELEHAEVLLRHAEQARSTLLKFMRGLCQQIGLDPHVAIKVGPIKELKRAYQKAVQKDISIDQLSDLLRARILVTDNNHVLGLRRAFVRGGVTDFIQYWEDRGVSIEAFDDKFYHPNPDTGYMDIQIKLKIKLGKAWHPVSAEIQVVHADMIDDYEMTHKIYERSREIRAKAKAAGRPLTNAEQEEIDLNRQTRRSIHLAGALRTRTNLLIDPKLTIFGEADKRSRKSGLRPRNG